MWHIFVYTYSYKSINYLAIYLVDILASRTHLAIFKLVGNLWNRTSVEVVDKLSSTSVDFIRSERELENMCLYGV